MSTPKPPARVAGGPRQVEVYSGYEFSKRASEYAADLEGADFTEWIIRPWLGATVIESYAPIRHPEILFEFARLYRHGSAGTYDVDMPELLKFTHRWGGLGTQATGVHPDDDQPSRRKPVAWVREDLVDTLSNIGRHVHGAAIGLMQVRDYQLHQLLSASERSRLSTGGKKQLTLRGRKFPARISAENAAKLARDINREFRSMRYEFAPDDEGDLTKGPLILTPLQAIFYHLADVLIGTIDVRRCAADDCMKIFQVTDQRMAYCPGPQWPLFPDRKMDSPCGARQRQRERVR